MNYCTRQFFTLSQVCHRLRSEFLPIYQKRTRVSIQPGDLQKYIDVFLNAPSVSLENVVGNIALTLYPREENYEDDITPLMRLAQYSTYFHATIVDHTMSHGDGFVTVVNKFFRHDEAPLLHAYLRNAVEKIELCKKSDEIFYKIHLGLRKEYWEDWMEGWSYRNRDMWMGCREVEDAMVNWGTGRGLDLSGAK